jgi:hypothetical protein
MSTRLKGRESLDPYDKRANAYGIRYDTPPLKKGLNWVSLRKYRLPKRKHWRSLDIDDRFVGRKYQGRLDDFSNPFKDITRPVFNYAKQMRDAQRYNLPKTDGLVAERSQYFTNPGDGDSWTNGSPAKNPAWDTDWLDEQA